MFNKQHSTVTQHVHQTLFGAQQRLEKLLLIMQLFIEVINIPRRFFSLNMDTVLENLILKQFVDT